MTTKIENDEEFIYVKKIRHYRTGKILLASSYGLVAFKIRIKKTQKDKKKDQVTEIGMREISSFMPI